ncbi:4-alpha-glucanotransferase [Pseudorhodoferax aquiterrae]|uniref:4-alpha-glucanotransferase n=1 Tax=Pseudorhodoferax aquiterrae TaxID=747304 RepID=A0ABQ3G6L3_9BURK|nr:4-alpha-glucanotransferase [Pseudorhodoferax aquiterrae]GHC91926.1 4-alpha-glucanotransferase [Pseudorhodoferax aquiterrae]
MSAAPSPEDWAGCAAAAGVLARYEAFDGSERQVPEAALRRALAAMGVAPDRPCTPVGLPACQVLREGQPLQLRWQAADDTPAHWELQDEELVGAPALASGAVAFAGGTASIAHSGALAPGYYRLRVRTAAGRQQCRVAVAPARCWAPAPLQAGARWWGYTVQLYALRSAHDCGIGDFGDLRRLVDLAAAQGAAFIGLNPLHALFPHRPQRASPYSPSSRLALNPLYLDLQAVVTGADCAEARVLWNDAAYQQRRQALRDTELVDYAGVAAAKEELLSVVWRHVDAQHAWPATGSRAFRAFLLEHDARLGMHALYEALQEHLAQQHEGIHGWQDWPEAYRDPQGAAVQSFRVTHAERVRYRMWLQFLAEQQLADVQAHARRAGMPIGLYRDLAVGVDPGGSETWLRPQLYALDMRIGAPPDLLQPQGQDWGLAPPTPPALRAAGYQPFIDTLRANMRSAGALRLDHVMVLMRLFWTGPEGGAYVRYPAEDLLGLLALESHRQRCLVVGEDLGTVPAEMQEAMQQRCVLSYRPLMFAQDAQGRFLAPADFPAQAFASFGTHDLPTLAGFWQAMDLRLQQQLGQAVDLQSAERQRAAVRQALLQALARAGLWPASGDAPGQVDTALLFAIHAYLARTPCWLVGVQLEDATLQPVQVNLPGTREDEFPNWRRKLGPALEALAEHPRLQAVVQALAARSWRGG